MRGRVIETVMFQQCRSIVFVADIMSKFVLPDEPILCHIPYGPGHSAYMQDDRGGLHAAAIHTELAIRIVTNSLNIIRDSNDWGFCFQPEALLSFDPPLVNCAGSQGHGARNQIR